MCKLSKYYDLKEDAINISELCRDLGISRTTFYNIWNGEKIPSVVLAIQMINYINDHIAKKFGVVCPVSVLDVWGDPDRLFP